MVITYEKNGLEIERFEGMPTESQIDKLKKDYDNVEIKAIHLEFIGDTLVKQCADLGNIEAKIVKSIKFIL